jgi:hypothetical protein
MLGLLIYLHETPPLTNSYEYDNLIGIVFSRFKLCSFMKGLRVMFSRLTHFQMLAFAAITTIIIAGCMREPPPVKMISVDASAAGTNAIKDYDSNKDGKISGAEFDKVPALREGLPQGFNTTKEKGVTADMITERIKKWQDVYKTGLMGSQSCQVTLAGKPLVGAEIKYVPEGFLGSNMPVCSGTTGPDGIASISVPVAEPTDPHGAPPGWYKVQITKAGENIPAKYNTQTTLGVEIAPDVRGTPTKFDLK